MSESLSRRSVITGRLADEMIHISSAVVSVLPQNRDDVVRALKAMDGVEVHHMAVSKIVVVMEAHDSGILGSHLAEIATWPGVLSANMVFEQAERFTRIGD